MSQAELWEKVRVLLTDDPLAKIVTDVGYSLCSGWGTLERVEYHPKLHAIELFFN